jgi:hypothetical protein
MVLERKRPTYLVFCELRIVHVLGGGKLVFLRLVGETGEGQGERGERLLGKCAVSFTLYQCFFTLPSVLAGNVCEGFFAVSICT